MKGAAWHLFVTATITDGGEVVVSEELQPDPSRGLPAFRISVTDAGIPTFWQPNLQKLGLSVHEVAAAQHVLDTLRAGVVQQLGGGA